MSKDSGQRGSLEDEIQTRQVGETWQRIQLWLQRNASATHAALRPGATEAEIASLEDAIGVRVPAPVRALWRLCAGSRDVWGAGLLPDHGWALMGLDAVEQSYRWHMDNQIRQAQRDPETLVWKPSWLPFCSWTITDVSYGMFVDGETGEIGTWDETAERTMGNMSLTMFLEDTADKLDYPELAAGYKPGLIDGALVWGPPLSSEDAPLWEPWTG